MKTSFCFLFVLLSLVRGDAPFFVGVGRYDVTGPAAEVNMAHVDPPGALTTFAPSMLRPWMGYANPTQTTHGIHFRQYSRAFIFVDAMMDKRVVFVNIDICMGTQAIKIEVVKKLQAQFGDLYNTDNVILSGTHTHSGPAGFFQYVLFEVTSLGFVKESLDAVVDGIVQSIAIAHANIQPSYLYLASGNLTDANINRSPTAYLMNPPEERAKYSKWGDTDKEMVVLKIANQNLKDIGMISWFAVHCTSMNNTNHLISGDNKGRASQLMEMAMNQGSLPGQGAFVAAFAQSNEGDVSPNTKGPHCLDSGKPCDILHSTCDGKNELCVAAGPGKDMFDSTDIIGMKQFTKGQELHNTANIGLNGPVDYRHMFVDMSNHPVTVNGTQVHTCPAAMGYSFAAGTTDGPGAFDFTQADTKSNPFWNLVRNVLHKPSPEQIECHKPKPILLDTGKLTWPYPWHPSIVPLQIARIGQLILVAVPGEFSTMSGRRLRETVYNTLIANGYSADTKVVIAGLSNTYTHYITTFEEYQEQRYEGASTIYGPHTLMAYQQEFASMAQAMAKGSPVPAGPSPPNYLSDQKSFLPPVLFDRAPLGKKIGDVHLDAKSQYSKGDNVTVIFWAGNPRNNLMTNKTFLAVEMNTTNGWTVVCTDDCWETRFKWYHTGIFEEVVGESQATITWMIPQTVQSGLYRIQHFGTYKSNDIVSTKLVPYSGTSSSFQVA